MNLFCFGWNEGSKLSMKLPCSLFSNICILEMIMSTYNLNYSLYANITYYDCATSRSWCHHFVENDTFKKIPIYRWTRSSGPCTTNLSEHTQAFLGKPGSTETRDQRPAVPQRSLRIWLVDPGFPLWVKCTFMWKGRLSCNFTHLYKLNRSISFNELVWGVHEKIR